MTSSEVLAQLMHAQQRNAGLCGSDLAEAANGVAKLARQHDALLVANDAAGERILGAALALHPKDCRPADLTARLDGAPLVLVSGAVAAPHALAQAVARLASLGAGAVHVAVLEGAQDGVLGAATLHSIGPSRATASAA